MAAVYNFFSSLTHEEKMAIVKSICLLPFKLIIEFIFPIGFYAICVIVDNKKIFDDDDTRGLRIPGIIVSMDALGLLDAYLKPRRNETSRDWTKETGFWANGVAIEKYVYILACLIFFFPLFAIYVLATPFRSFICAAILATTTVTLAVYLVADPIASHAEQATHFEKRSVEFYFHFSSCLGLIAGTYISRISSVQNALSVLLDRHQPNLLVRTFVANLYLIYPSLTLWTTKQTSPSNPQLLLDHANQPIFLTLIALTWTSGFLMLLSTLPVLTRGIAAGGILVLAAGILRWPCSEYQSFRWESFNWRAYADADNYSLQTLFVVYWVWVVGVSVFNLSLVAFRGGVVRGAVGNGEKGTDLKA